MDWERINVSSMTERELKALNKRLNQEILVTPYGGAITKDTSGELLVHVFQRTKDRIKEQRRLLKIQRN